MGFSLLVDDVLGESQKIRHFASVNEAISSVAQFVLIGDPGAGKTTSLRKLAHDEAIARIENPQVNPFPIFAYLPQWADTMNFDEFLDQQIPFAKSARELLQNKTASLYLDGLNEMGATTAQKVAQLREWLQELKGVRVVISCRKGDYRGDLKLEVSTLEVNRLNDGQVKQFAQKYLGERAAKFVDLLGNPNQERSLQELAKNPYMLSALIYMYEHSDKQELPKNSAQLSKRMTQALWLRETKHRNTDLSYTVAAEAFARFAYQMISDGQAIDVSRDYALQFLSDELLQVGEYANILVLSENSVRFYHQLLQEYFAALALTDTQLSSLLEKPEFTYGSRIVQVWDEVLVNYLGLAPNPEKLLIDLAEIDPYLAMRVLPTLAGISQVTIQAVITSLTQYTKHPDWSARAAIPHYLAPFEIRDYEALLQKLIMDSAKYVGELAKSLMKKQGGDLETVVRNALGFGKDTAIRSYQLTKFIDVSGRIADFHAHQEISQREIHIRMIYHHGDSQFMEQFEANARSLARLEHPHIVPLYDYWNDSKTSFIASRWFNGGTLRSYLKLAQLTIPQIVRIINQLCSALQFAHMRGVIHTDIRAENIFLDEMGNVYLGNFDFSYDFLNQEERENLLMSFPMDGLYLAPELWKSEKPSPMSDIYSVGILLYELLTGRLPFESAENLREVMMMQLHNPVPSMLRYRPDLLPEFDTIIWQATAKRKESRHTSALHLAMAFQMVAGRLL